jgi:hypothetical protein
MLEMSSFARGGRPVSTHYTGVLARVRADLERLAAETFAANSDAEIADNLASKYGLEPLEKDPGREPTSEHQSEFWDSRDQVINRSGRVEVEYARIVLPFVPKPSNAIAMTLQGQTWPGSSSVSAEGRYDERSHALVFRVHLGSVEQVVRLIDQRIGIINADIVAHEPHFRDQVLQLVQNRRAQVEKQRSRFDEKMSALGIKVVRKDDAREPVNVQVKREIQVMREPPLRAPGPAEPHLAAESLAAILALIDQSGKSMEVAPSGYAKLGETELRDIVVGHLNAVFGGQAATGETFSKRGKTDVHLIVPGGAVLVGECLLWKGKAYYIGKLEQIFGYLTLRHTDGVLITFSKTKGLSGQVTTATDAIAGHPSTTSPSVRKHATYFVSEHRHPADDDRRVTIHHLLFDLAV